jgi:amino acid adenylation domain-containing protein
MRSLSVDGQLNFYPLSYPQMGIWHLEKIFPDTCIGNIAATLRIESSLDYGVLEQAANYFIKMNDAIRIRISEKDGEAKQYVSDYSYQKLDLMDFSDKDIGALYEWDERTTKTPFYNTDSQLFHFVMIKINDTLGGLYVKLHHLIADAWTLVIFGNELMEYYSDMIHGRELATDGKPSYIDYLSGEQNYLRSERFEKDEAFWLEKFKDMPELTTLKDKKNNKTGIHAARKTFILPEKLSKKIRQHCTDHKTSIFSLFLGAMAIYFNRTKGVNDIVFGTPVLNRSNAREKETMGMFISTVPIRITIDETQDYTTFAESIGKEWMSILRHQKYPYTLLLKKLRERNPGLDKIYDIVISYQNAKFNKNDEEYRHEGRWHQNGCQTDSLNVHINDREDDGRIIVDYDYQTDLFYAKEIDFFHDHVVRLLWHSIDDPTKKLPYIDMISEKEKYRILHEFNNTKTAYQRGKYIHTFFEETAARVPDKIALVFENRVMTYRELNEKANRLACVLRKQGIKPNDIVGLMVKRSFDMITGILGILKSGAAYMPIDKDHPVDRVSYMLKNSRSDILVTQKELPEIPDFAGTVIDIQDRDIDMESCENTQHSNGPDDTAYVIYTSGSTGMPKGVALRHDSLTNFISTMSRMVRFDPGKTMISITSSSFDIFIFETLLPLTQGLKVVISNENEQKIPRLLKELIINNAVDMLQTTPTRMKFYIDHKDCDGAFGGLTDIILGGEVFRESLLKKLKSLTKARIYNGYGPSETTIYSTFKDLTNENVINIGRPLANTSAYIVDKYLNLLPIGIAGELCISGSGVMKGYVNRPELSREKLIENPFVPGEMMYKTGDLASWYAEGEIGYIGRTDNQAKINGLRIEFEEIEIQLNRIENIKDAVVTIKEDMIGKPQLCAYVISDNDISLHDIRSRLSKKLPNYMIPSFIMKIDSIPLTATGKIDKKSLPMPISGILSENIYVPPGDYIEKMLAETYAKILRSDKIGINDNFFELGGDSLGVIELVSYLYKYGLNVEIQDVYEYPVIRDLKKCVIRNKKGTADRIKSAHHAPAGPAPLFDLIRNGSLPPVNSAALTYIPDKSVTGGSNFIKGPVGDKPVLYNYMTSGSENIGIIALPLEISDLYNDRNRTVALCIEAVRMAQDIGAGVVSLTGLIPSATENGIMLQKALDNTDIHTRITTGHATTAAAVILSLIKLLDKSKRDLSNENLCVLGIGSIGTAVIKLMMSVLPHPLSIVLCDLPGKKDALIGLRSELADGLGYRGDINLVYSGEHGLPDEIYDTSLIVGATNVPDILGIDRLKPGTLIVDDSGPHCFSVKKAKTRLIIDGDILFTEGGVLESPAVINRKIYLPESIDAGLVEKLKMHFASNKEITGCILSSLLSAKYDRLLPKVGRVDLQDCMDHYNLLIEKGYKGAALHCDDFIVPANIINKFADAFQNRHTFIYPNLDDHKNKSLLKGGG